MVEQKIVARRISNTNKTRYASRNGPDHGLLPQIDFISRKTQKNKNTLSSSAEFEKKSQRQEKYQRFVDNQIFQHDVGGGPILVV